LDRKATALAPQRPEKLAEEVIMNGTVYSEEITMNPEAGKPSQLTELVRGSEGRFIDELTPVVRRQNVSLDLASVERIDAAGIAALISLYRIARESGHRFSLSKVSARVAEMLALVGLDGLLLSRNAKMGSHSTARLVRHAA
jgi:anti-anti-sigma factor